MYIFIVFMLQDKIVFKLVLTSDLFPHFLFVEYSTWTKTDTFLMKFWKIKVRDQHLWFTLLFL